MAPRIIPRHTGLALVLLCLSAALLFMQADSASAEITEDDIGCDGSADIRDKDGGTTHIDAEDAEATVPREGTVRWRGSTSEPVHNHNGEIEVDLGDGIPIDEWGSENTKDETEKRGRKKLPAILKYLPPGTYLVTGSHSGDEGSCAGEIEITIEGGALDTAWKAGGLVLTVVTAFGVFVAGRPRV